MFSCGFQKKKRQITFSRLDVDEFDIAGLDSVPVGGGLVVRDIDTLDGGIAEHKRGAQEESAQFLEHLFGGREERVRSGKTKLV